MPTLIYRNERYSAAMLPGSEASSMKRLKEEPQARPRDVSELLGLAVAMEEAALRRYSDLAAQMQKLGELQIAGTFRALIEEQRDHIEDIAHRSMQMIGAPPEARVGSQYLPFETVRSWDEAAAS